MLVRACPNVFIFDNNARKQYHHTLRVLTRHNFNPSTRSQRRAPLCLARRGIRRFHERAQRPAATQLFSKNETAKRLQMFRMGDVAPAAATPSASAGAANERP